MIAKKKHQHKGIELRDYQRQLLDAIYDWFNYNEGNPCAVLPTAGGKSIVLAQFCKEQLQEYKGLRILMLAPTRELVEQNSSKLRAAWPNAPMGVYSSALKRRELYEPITVANIHSIHDKLDLMPVIDILLIDEAHMVPNNDTGMYRKLIRELKIRNPKLVVIGFTATPFRLGQGELTHGEEAIFDDLIEVATVGDLIRAGWLSKLKSKATELKLNISGVKLRGGEFVESALQKAVDTDDDNARVAAEIAEIAYAHDRRAILVFCAGVDHAHHMRDALELVGVKAAVVTGKTPAAERAQIFKDFRARKYQALCNVAIATTGFDYPDIDLIAMVRPTMSKVLYVQMVGRALRLKEHTDYAVILDFAGNVERHGPITEYEEVKPPQKSGGEAPTKNCPSCSEIVFAGYRNCPECGHAFPPPVKEKANQLRDDDIMGRALEPPAVMKIKAWRWWKHVSKKNGKEMLAVKYIGAHLGTDLTEYILVQHEGTTGQIAIRTLFKMMKDAGEPGLPDCDTLEEAAEKLNRVRPPSEIEYRMEGRFPKILRRTFGEIEHVDEAPSDFDNVIPYEPGKQAPQRSPVDYYDADIPF